MIEASLNTDKEIWRGPDEGAGDYYADSLFMTQNGSLGINCGGYVFVKPIREWFELAGGEEHFGKLSPRPLPTNVKTPT